MVAYEYAKALFELAGENKNIDLYLEYLNAVTDSFKNKDFYNVLTSPIIEHTNKKDVVKKVFKDFDEEFIHFLFVLIDHNRVNILEQINEEYLTLALNNKNIIKAEIVSADKLTKSQLKQFETTLKSKYAGKKIEITNIVDLNLIGGVKVLIEGKVIDISIKTSIDRLKESL